MKFLCLGYGSIGRRHSVTLRSLGHTVLSVDSNRDADFKEIPTFGDFDGYLICTPPEYHYAYAKDLCFGEVPALFIEKPLGVKDLGSWEKLDLFARCQFLVGYQLRFHPGLEQIKKDLTEPPISIDAEFGFYLPYWRSDTDWKNSYTRKLGIILDSSHELDYIRWLCGDVESVYCVSDNTGLGDKAEDVAEILLRFKNGTIGRVHLDMIQGTYTRKLKVVTNTSTLTWGWTNSEIDLSTYRLEMEHFVRVCEGKEKPLVTLHDGIEAMRIGLAARKSSASRNVVKV